jgi:endoglucanase
MYSKISKLIFVFSFLLSFSMSFSQAGVQNYLTAEGNKLVDKRGQTVLLTGINWFGFETSNMFPHGIWSRDMKSVLQQIKDLGFNTIRVPWCNQMLNAETKIKIDSYGTDAYTKVSPMNLEESTKTKPIELLDIMVDWCQTNNMKIILDNHSKRTDGYLTEGLWYTDGYDEARWISDWIFMANRYKGKSAVVGCDLKNEPHITATWGNSSPSTDWNKAAERCGNAILSANPELLIFVEGVEKYNGESSWWGGQLKGARDFPVVLSNPKKLVYSPHEYGPELFTQNWFKDPTFPRNMSGVWNNNFGFLYENNTAPIYVGEFGIKDQDAVGGQALTWMKTFLEFMKGRYSFTYWCINPNSGDTGGILKDDWSSINQWKMDLLKPLLTPLIPNVVGTTGGVNQAPVASFTTDKTTGTSPLTVNFDASRSSDPEGEALTYTWSFGDSTPNGTGRTVSHTYNTEGSFNATLTVRDPKNATNSSSVTIVVSKTAPVSFTITTNAGSNGSISPSGAVSVPSGTNRTFTITPNSGFQIDAVSVNGTSIGSVATYTFNNVTSNQTIAVTFKAISTGGGGGGACLLSRFGVPRAAALPNVNNLSFSKVYTLGTGAPDLSNVNNAVLNWSLANNGLWQLSFNLSKAPYWIDMRNNVQNFKDARPAITFNGTGISNLDNNKYYINIVDSNNIVFVEVSGKHAFYFSNSTTAPAGCSSRISNTVENKVLKVTPNPVTDFVKINVSGVARSKNLLLYDASGKIVLEKQLNPNTEEDIIDMNKFSKGLYMLIYRSDDTVLTKNIIKQ